MPNYTIEGTLGVPKNKLGATDPDTLEKKEASYVETRQLEIFAGTVLQKEARTPDTSFLQLLHHHLFQDVYEFAGVMRHQPHRLSDGTIATEPMLRKQDGKLFLPGAMIPKALASLDADLAKSNFLKGLSPEDFARKAGDLLVQLNNIHPFREGNGRTQRLFIREIGIQAGHKFDFKVISGERMIQASIAGHNGDPSLMRRLTLDAIDQDRVRELSDAKNFLAQHEIGWNNLYVTTAQAGMQYKGTVAAVGPKNFILREDDSRLIVGRLGDVPGPVIGGSPLEFGIPASKPELPFSGTRSPDEIVARAQSYLRTNEDTGNEPQAPKPQRRRKSRDENGIE